MNILSARYLILLCLMITIGQCGIGLYLPSLPMIAQEFDASIELTKNTVIYYLLGIAISQLFYGPLSDHYGRKKVALIGMGIFISATVLVISSNSIYLLLMARLIQGIGIGASTIISRAVLRDVFHGVEYAKSGARLASVVAIAPIIAPLLGGYFQAFSGWRLSFIILLLFSIVTCVLWIFLFKETAPACKEKSFSLIQSIKNYYSIAKSLFFLKNALCGGLIYSGEMAILTVIPFFFQTQLQASSITFGWCMLILALGFIAGARCSVYLANRMHPRSLIRLGLVITTISSLLLLLINIEHYISLPSVTAILFLFLFGAGFVYPNTSVSSVGLFPEKAGTASALFSAIQGLLAALCSFVLSCFSNSTLYPLAIMLLGLMFFSIRASDTIAVLKK